MEQILVLDIKPAGWIGRLMWNWKAQPLEIEEIPLPFCRMRRVWLPYDVSVQTGRYQRAMEKMLGAYAGWKILAAKTKATQEFAPFAPYQKEDAPMLRRLCLPMVARLLRVCGFAPGKTPIYVKAKTLTGELEQLMQGLSDLTKFLYLDLERMPDGDAQMLQFYERTGACVLPAETFEADGFCIGILWSGRLEETARFYSAKKTILLNLGGALAAKPLYEIDGVILDAQTYGILHSKNISELAVVSLLDMKLEDLPVSGFTDHGQPLFLRGLSA